MATYQILYWKEFPTQVRAQDNLDEVTLELDRRFQELIDEVATERGLVGSDEYLEGWHWSDPQERSGSAQDVAESVKRELEEARFPPPPSA